MQSLPIVRTAIEQFHKLDLQSQDVAKPRVDRGHAAEHEADVSTIASRTIEKEKGRCMITELPGELRNQIYGDLILKWNTRELHLIPQETKARGDVRFLNIRALSQTCRLLRNEFAPLLKSRFVFPIELAYLGKYLDDFHPPIVSSNSLRRHGGSIMLLWNDYDSASCEDTRLDLLSLTRIIHESPGLHISFQRHRLYTYLSDLSGSFLLEVLLQNYESWQHLAEQLTSIGLTGIYLRSEGQELEFRSKQHIAACCYTVMLEFKDSTDTSQGPSIFPDARAQLVTSWLFRSGMLNSWGFYEEIAIECKKSNGKGIHYWMVNNEHLTDDRKCVNLLYAFKTTSDRSAMLCEHVIEYEPWRRVGRRS